LKKILVLILGVFILSGCGQSEFDKNMDQGKEFLKSKQYDEAIESFNYALIDDPTNNDAKILLDKANTERIETNMKEMITKYKNDFKPLMIRYLGLVSQQSTEDLTVDIQQNRALDLIQLKKDTQFFIADYGEYQQIIDLHNNLINTIDYAEKCQNNIITLLKYVDESGVYLITQEDAETAQTEMAENKEQRDNYLNEFQKSFSALTTKYGVNIDG